jgi:hypothetical protein
MDQRFVERVERTIRHDSERRQPTHGANASRPR